MNEAKQQLITEWNGLMSKAAECLELRRENARLRELLKRSKRLTKKYKQGAWIVEERHRWTDEQIDKELRNGRED